MPAESCWTVHRMSSAACLPSVLSYGTSHVIRCIVFSCPPPSPSSYQHTSYRREERLAAQIARSKEMRQEGFSRGREEFLASAITMATGGGSSHERERERERDRERSHSMFARVPVVSIVNIWATSHSGLAAISHSFLLQSCWLLPTVCRMQSSLECFVIGLGRSQGWLVGGLVWGRTTTKSLSYLLHCSSPLSPPLPISGGTLAAHPPRLPSRTIHLLTLCIPPWVGLAPRWLHLLQALPIHLEEEVAVGGEESPLLLP